MSSPPQDNELSPQWHASFTESPPVEITVGDGEHKYYVHKDKLCSKSGYFRARTDFYETNLNESNTMKAHLDASNGHDPKAFGIIAQWFYDGPEALVAAARCENRDYNARRQAQVLLTRVYIEADRLIIPQLKNQVMDTIIIFSHQTLPSMKALKLVKEALPLQTALERYFFDLLVWWLIVCPDFFDYVETGWHNEANEYLQEHNGVSYRLLKAVCPLRYYGHAMSPNESPGCRYHEHGEGAPVEDCPGRAEA